jgi:hypothetical protein
MSHLIYFADNAATDSTFIEYYGILLLMGYKSLFLEQDVLLS